MKSERFLRKILSRKIQAICTMNPVRFCRDRFLRLGPEPRKNESRKNVAPGSCWNWPGIARIGRDRKLLEQRPEQAESCATESCAEVNPEVK